MESAQAFVSTFYEKFFESLKTRYSTPTKIKKEWVIFDSSSWCWIYNLSFILPEIFSRSQSVSLPSFSQSKQLDLLLEYIEARKEAEKKGKSKSILQYQIGTSNASNASYSARPDSFSPLMNALPNHPNEQLFQESKPTAVTLNPSCQSRGLGPRFAI